MTAADDLNRRLQSLQRTGADLGMSLAAIAAQRRALRQGRPVTSVAESVLAEIEHVAGRLERLDRALRDLIQTCQAEIEETDR
jgi:hypothetical protein